MSSLINVFPGGSDVAIRRATMSIVHPVGEFTVPFALKNGRITGASPLHTARGVFAGDVPVPRSVREPGATKSSA
jgi:hypothetical protein